MTARRIPTGGRSRRRLAAVVCAAAVGIGCLTVADAATLAVAGPSVATSTATACTSGTQPIRVAPIGLLGLLNWGVRLSDVPPSCQGKPIVVSANSNGVTGSSTGATGSSVDIGTDVFLGSPTFTVLVDGWVVATTT
jgi:hypothetical protein